MVLRNGHHQLAAEVSGRLMRRTSVMRYPTRGCQCDPPSRLTAAPPSGNSCVNATWKPISRLTRKVISIPAHGAADNRGGKAMTVIKRFCFRHRTIIRDLLANVTEPFREERYIGHRGAAGSQSVADPFSPPSKVTWEILSISRSLPLFLSTPQSFQRSPDHDLTQPALRRSSAGRLSHRCRTNGSAQG